MVKCYRMAVSSIPRGLLVVIEGIDGAGKTTLAQGLRRWLEEVGAPVRVSKEPTTGPWGTKLRASAASGRLTPQQELKYLIQDRMEHVETLIAPALDAGEIVILDRYYPSTVAYQGAAGMPLNALLDANGFAPIPDVLLLLDLPPALGLERIRARGDEPNLFEVEDALALSREIFLKLEMPKVVIDARQDAAHVQAEAQKAVLLALTERFRRELSPTDTVERLTPYLSGQLTATA